MVLLLTVTLSTYAQNKIVTVSGRVIEAGTKEPVELAAVQLLSLPDSAQVAGMTTSAQGYFSLSKQKPGKYLLKVSFIGYMTKWEISNWQPMLLCLKKQLWWPKLRR